MTQQMSLFDQDREFHPLTRILPPVSADEDLIASIAAALGNGRNFLEYFPITLDREGRIVDGRLRYLACLRAGVEPVYETLPSHYTDVMILDLIRSKNVCRQHPRDDQRALIAAGLGREAEGRP